MSYGARMTFEFETDATAPFAPSQGSASFHLGLFDSPAPAQSHRPMSIQAARAIEPRTGTLRGFVLSYIPGTGVIGATDEEIQHAFNMNPSTQRP
jgi:hypothetical protein